MSFLFLSFPKTAFAQGTYDCKWIDAGGKFACRSANISCNSGYIPDNSYCFSKKSKSICNASTHNYCILQTSPTPTSSPIINPLCNGNKGIDTAIGCISVLESPEAFLGDILRWAVGVGGGIAFLLIVYASFIIMTSSGNPERLKAGQELLTSAISGLVLLIFSVFILKLIGIDILKLCKFGFGKPC